MQRLPVIYRPEAVDDLEEVFLYVLEASRDFRTAQDYTERIRARCESIGNAPRGGRPRDDLFPGLRTVPFESSAVIVYVVRVDAVEIVNVYHGGRDYEALFLGADDA